MKTLTIKIVKRAHRRAWIVATYRGMVLRESLAYPQQEQEQAREHAHYLAPRGFTHCRYEGRRVRIETFTA